MPGFSTASKSGGAPPHSKTQAKLPRPESRPRFGVRQCSAAFERTLVGLRSKTSLDTNPVAGVVEIDLLVALPGECESETGTAKTTSQTPAPGDIAVFKSKARLDAQVLLLA